MLPKSEWKGRTAALGENDSDDKASGESPSEPMPTGEPIRKYFCVCLMKIVYIHHV